MRPPVGPDSSTMEETRPANSPVSGEANESRDEETPAPTRAGEPREPAPPAVTLSGGSAAPPGIGGGRRPRGPPPRRGAPPALPFPLQIAGGLANPLFPGGRPRADFLGGATRPR